MRIFILDFEILTEICKNGKSFVLRKQHRYLIIRDYHPLQSIKLIKRYMIVFLDNQNELFII